MWPFKRKKSQGPQRSGPICTHCRSSNTKVMSHYRTGQPDYVRTWRGQRYLTCRCFDCGRDFYAKEPLVSSQDQFNSDNELIDNEEELYAAEEEIRKNTEASGDRKCW